MKEITEYLKTTSAQWPGVSVGYRESWGCEYFQVAEKGFCMLGTNKENDVVMTVKGLPGKNEELREMYEWIVPGYYANKTHWISVILKDSQFSQEELLGLLRKSYDLVVANLTKKVRENLK